MKKEKTKKAFTITGTVQLGSKNVPFTKQLNAHNAGHATEKTLTLFGSKNKVKRRFIQITSAKETKE